VTRPLRRLLFATALAAAVALVAPAAGSAQTAGDPVPTWSPSELTFGKTKLGTPSDTRRVDVVPGAGCGAGWMPPLPCTLSYGFLDVAVSGPFEIVATTCHYGENVSPCVVVVRFRPPSRGRHDGFLRITNNRGMSRGVPLSGEGCERARSKRKGKKRKQGKRRKKRTPKLHC
jgi:hypothetical protein